MREPAGATYSITAVSLTLSVEMGTVEVSSRERQAFI
jgi:hypothetical protein